MTMQNPTFETDRLLIRPWNPSIDAEPAFAIYGDAEVMHFIRPPAMSVAEVRTSMEQSVARYAELNNGTGTWAIAQRLKMTPMGRVDRYYGLELELFRLKHQEYIKYMK